MNFGVFIELQKRKLKYEKTPKRNELLPLNYAYCLLCMQVPGFRTRGSRTWTSKSNWRSLKWFACLASCIHLQLTTWKLFLSPRFVLMCKISGGLLLNIQKLFDVYRKLKAWYSSTTIPQVAKWLSKNCGKQDPLNIIFLDFNFNSNKRITEANQNSRLGAYNNTNLILKTTEWMIYKELLLNMLATIQLTGTLRHV